MKEDSYLTKIREVNLNSCILVLKCMVEFFGTLCLS